MCKKTAGLKAIVGIIIIGVMLMIPSVLAGIDSKFTPNQDLISSKSSELSKATTTNYGKYELTETKWYDLFGWFGEEKIKEVELQDNTDECSDNCYMITEITNLKPMPLIDEVRFYREVDGKMVKWDSYTGWDIFVEEDVDLYDYVCSPIEKGTGRTTGNETLEEDCEMIVTRTEKQFVPLDLEKNYEGTYKIKLTGYKKANVIYDWQIKTNGEWLTEWAVWGSIGDGDDAEVTLNSPADNIIVYNNPIIFNFTATINGARLNNMTFYTNESGVWKGEFEDKFGSLYPIDDSNFTPITTCLELQNMKNNLNGNYKLMNDIDCSDTINWNSGNGFEPIGSSSNKFNGKFNGRGYEIKNISMYRIHSYVGIFSYINTNSIVANIKLTNFTITSGNGGGTLAGNNNGLISHIYVDSFKVRAWDNDAGGIVGYNHGTITNSFSSGDSTAFSDGAGGIVGANYGGVINNSYSTATHTSKSYHSSVAGENTGTIMNSYGINGVSGGGAGTIINSYSGTNLNEKPKEYFVNWDFDNIWGQYKGVNNNYPFLKWTTSLSGKNLDITNTYPAGSTIEWNVKYCDSDGDCGFATQNRTFSVDGTAPTITLNYPTSLMDYGGVNQTLQLNFTATDTNLDKVWYNYNGTNITITGATSGVWNISNITLSSKKNVTIYANDTMGNLNTKTYSWDYKVFEKEVIYNNETYETKDESFIINISNSQVLTNVYLNYNGIDYLTTKNGDLYSKTLPMELVNTDTNRTFYYKFEYAGSNITSPSSIQLVKTYLVNWTGTKQYVNITIKDEYDNSIINSTTLDTLFDYYIDAGGYSNIHQEIYTQDGVYGLFSTPNILRWSADGRLYYYATGYQPRYYFLDDEEFTNSSITQKTIYLLLQTDGILARYKIYDTSGNLMSEARITAYKIVGSNEILVEQVLTDSLGEASLFLNPNYYHRIIISKDDCTSIDRERRITSSDTTNEFMSCTGGNGGISDYNLTTFENVSMSLLPSQTVHYTTDTVTFSFTTSDSNCNLDETRYVLKFGGVNVVSLTGTNPCGETLSQAVDLSSYSGTLVGYGTAVIGSNQVTLTRQYTVLDITNTSYNQTSVKDLLDKIKDPTFGLEVGLTPSTKAFLVFLVLFGLIGAFGTQTAKDNIPITLMLISIFLFIPSYLGFLTVFNSDYEIINQYGLALIVSSVSLIGITIRRYL